MSRINLKLFTFALSLFVFNSLQADEEFTVLWEIDDLNTPESVLYDTQRDIIFLSNVDGAPTDKDNKGYISVLTIQGEMLNKHWVTGLNAPKGLGVYKDTLYVTDIDTLLAININNGKVEQRYYASEAKFLNDIIIDSNGVVYVSDMGTSSIYRLVDNEFTIWLQDDKLENPNGLYLENDHLIVGSWGRMANESSMNALGHLKIVSIKDKSINSLGDGTPIGNLDGVESDGNGNFYVTDWVDGTLFLIQRNGQAEKLLNFPQGSADHEVVLDKKIMIIPKMMEDKLTAYRLK